MATLDGLLSCPTPANRDPNTQPKMHLILEQDRIRCDVVERPVRRMTERSPAAKHLGAVCDAKDDHERLAA